MVSRSASPKRKSASPKRKSASPKYKRIPLTKTNANKMNALRRMQIKTKAGYYPLPPEVAHMIANKLKNAQPDVYEPIYNYKMGQDFFYTHFKQIWATMDRYLWKLTKEWGGYPTGYANGSVHYNSKDYRPMITLAKLKQIFRPKIRMGNNNASRLKHAVIVPQDSKPQDRNKKWLLLMDVLEGYRKPLKNNYNACEGFVDALLDEIDAELDAL